MSRMKRWMALVAASALLLQYAQAADRAALLAAARAQEPAVIESLREMVLIESGTTDAQGLARMVEYAEARLRALGAAPERIPMARGHAHMVKGTLQGTGKRNFLLIAHLDTVYQPGVLKEQPLRRDGNRLYGPGVADDKGGVAVILHALAMLQQAAWRDYGRITVLFNPDEESGSTGSGETLAQLGAEADVVLSFEPTPAKAMLKAEGVLLAAAGTATATLEVKGRASHAGAAPDQGRNALVELAHRMVQTHDTAKSIPGAQLNWTMVEGLNTRNQIPDRALAGGDVRLTQPGAAERLQEALRGKLAEPALVPDTQTQVRLEIGRPPYVAGARGLALAELARKIYAELDERPLIFIPGSGGGTDAGFAGRSGKPAVLESLGLAGWGYHARDEYVELDSIVPRLYLATRLLVELSRP